MLCGIIFFSNTENNRVTLDVDIIQFQQLTAIVGVGVNRRNRYENNAENTQD